MRSLCVPCSPCSLYTWRFRDIRVDTRTHAHDSRAREYNPCGGLCAAMRLCLCSWHIGPTLHRTCVWKIHISPPSLPWNNSSVGTCCSFNGFRLAEPHRVSCRSRTCSTVHSSLSLLNTHPCIFALVSQLAIIQACVSPTSLATGTGHAPLFQSLMMLGFACNRAPRHTTSTLMKTSGREHVCIHSYATGGPKSIIRIKTTP